MSDPQDFDRAFDYDHQLVDRSSTSTGNWIAGIVFLIVVLALGFGIGGETSRSAGTVAGVPAAAGSAPSTTGSGSARLPRANPTSDYPTPAPAGASTPNPPLTR